MRYQISIIFLLFSKLVFAQVNLTADSFYLKPKPFPKNYKLLLEKNEWRCLGTYAGKLKRRKAVIDSIGAGWTTDRKITSSTTDAKNDLVLFDDGKHYRKIRSRRIVSNADFNTETIVFVDSSTVTLERVVRKTTYRTLYRRKL